PKRAGRSTLTLPAVSIAIARANGDRIVLCTKKHEIVVDEPIANELDPKVVPNPPPRPQREEWVFLKQLLAGIGIGVAASVALGFLVRWWLKRPKPVAPVPKRPPWLVALEELEAIRRSTLLDEQKNDVYLDRVSDCVRKYLGDRYGFDQLEQGNNGLETTTDEMRALLSRVRPPIMSLLAIVEFLEECDLVKFARVFPGVNDCVDALGRAEQIVRQTTPL